MALEEFFTTLRTSRKSFEWVLNSKGAIRGRLRSTSKGKAKNGYAPFCPLTAAAFVKTGKKLNIGNPSEAARALSIRSDTVSRIVDAADSKLKQPTLRKRILAAVDLPA